MDEFLEVARKAALEAGKIITKSYGKKHKLVFKEDNADFATQVDLEAEKKIAELLTKSFPTHNIVSEEKIKIDNKSKYTWAIDPIDGTVSYASKMPFFSVSIGLLEDNSPVVGVIFHVSQNDLYWAQKGQGAYLNGKKISVSSTDQLESSVIGLGIGGITQRRKKINEYFIPLISKVRYVYLLGGGAVTMSYIARGLLDAMPNEAWSWDEAAGYVIITEAGGRITDKFGNPVDWSKDRPEFIASNGLIHDQLLEALKQ